MPLCHLHISRIGASGLASPPPWDIHFKRPTPAESSNSMRQALLQPQKGIAHVGIAGIETSPHKEAENRASALGVALESIKGRAQAGVSDLALAIEVEGHNMGRKLDVVARRLHIDTANFEVTTVLTLPPLEKVAPERIVRIDGEAERPRVDVGIGVPDLESLLGVRHVLSGDGADDRAAEDVVGSVQLVALTLILGRGEFDRLGQNVKGGQFALGIVQGDAEEIVGRLDFGRSGSVVLGGGGTGCRWRTCCAGFGSCRSGCWLRLAGSHSTERVAGFDQQSQAGKREKKGRLHLRVGCSDVMNGLLVRGSVLADESVSFRTRCYSFFLFSFYLSENKEAHNLFVVLITLQPTT